ncbi:Dynein, intermediate chain, flagellar outer arm [Chionoecetes opilio]|uniref:Dynein, intermediate chain, flagellar outer arm n=1 Tax=Chionoecetes opilio TaxID=41210 RepID=A0A8J4YUI8_CHIOP|nr:Dynein, intermediate chain, flagellar outer arm [Chionoecetes opilio]
MVGEDGHAEHYDDISQGRCSGARSLRESEVVFSDCNVGRQRYDDYFSLHPAAPESNSLLTAPASPQPDPRPEIPWRSNSPAWRSSGGPFPLHPLPRAAGISTERQHVIPVRRPPEPLSPGKRTSWGSGLLNCLFFVRCTLSPPQYRENDLTMCDVLFPSGNSLAAIPSKRGTTSTTPCKARSSPCGSSGQTCAAAWLCLTCAAAPSSLTSLPLPTQLVTQGRRVLVCSACIHPQEPATPQRVYHTPCGVTSLHFHPQVGRLLAAGWSDGRVVLYDVRPSSPPPSSASPLPSPPPSGPLLHHHLGQAPPPRHPELASNGQKKGLQLRVPNLNGDGDKWSSTRVHYKVSMVQDKCLNGERSIIRCRWYKNKCLNGERSIIRYRWYKNKCLNGERSIIRCQWYKNKCLNGERSIIRCQWYKNKCLNGERSIIRCQRYKNKCLNGERSIIRCQWYKNKCLDGERSIIRCQWYKNKCLDGERSIIRCQWYKNKCLNGERSIIRCQWYKNKC